MCLSSRTSWRSRSRWLQNATEIVSWARTSEMNSHRAHMILLRSRRISTWTHLCDVKRLTKWGVSRKISFLSSHNWCPSRSQIMPWTDQCHEAGATLNNHTCLMISMASSKRLTNDQIFRTAQVTMSSSACKASLVRYPRSSVAVR